MSNFSDWFSGTCRTIKGVTWYRWGAYARDLTTGKIVKLEKLVASKDREEKTA